MLTSLKEFERRTSERVEYRGYCTILFGDQSWMGNIVDISRTGALVAILEGYQLKRNDKVTLNVDLADGTVAMLQGRIAHIKAHFVGMECVPHSEKDTLKLEQFLRQAGLLIET